MVCKICPTRKYCWDKGDCENCDFGKVFENLNAKNKRLKAKKQFLEKENERIVALASNSAGLVREIFSAVSDAWHETYYEEEFEERLATLEKKYIPQ